MKLKEIIKDYDSEMYYKEKNINAIFRKLLIIL